MTPEATTGKRSRSPSSSDLSTLFCFIVGSDDDEVFPVDISSSSTVGHLKREIKQENPHRLSGIDASQLRLFQISLPPGPDLADRVNVAIQGAVALSGTTKIRDFIPDDPPEDTIHIAVKLRDDAVSSKPVYDSLVYYRQHYLDKCSPIAPSTRAQPNELYKNNGADFCYERPPLGAGATTVPVTLLHPVFNEFIDDCDSYQPTEADHAFALDLAYAMCGIFPDEKLRQKTFIAICEKHGLSFTPSEIVGTRCKTDGDMRCNGCIYCLGELKNEVGSKGAEPVFQAGCYYTTYLKNLDGAAKLNSPLPCLGLYLIGPLLGFLGLAFAEEAQLQVLGQPIRFDYHHTDVKQRRTAARYLGAMKRGIEKLKNYYDVEMPKLRIQSNTNKPKFPGYSTYTALENSAQRTIQYIKRVHNKLVFFGKSDGVDICIKFVTQYSKEAHLYCAEMGIAPSLRGFEKLPGGWLMVVMDWVDEEYCPFHQADFDPTWRAGMRELMSDKLRDFHEKGYVHGDIRDTNVMVRRDGKLGFMLLDFDWSGSSGDVLYPMNVNKGPDLWRPDAVKDEAPIKADHDIQMLDRMFAERDIQVVDPDSS